jgi:hypothetical protein
MSIYNALKDVYENLAPQVGAFGRMQGGRVWESLSTVLPEETVARTFQRQADVSADVANYTPVMNLFDSAFNQLKKGDGFNDKKSFLKTLAEYDFKSGEAYPQEFHAFDSIAKGLDTNNTLQQSGFNSIIDAYKHVVHDLPMKYLGHDLDSTTARLKNFEDSEEVLYDPHLGIDVDPAQFLNSLTNGRYMPGVKRLLGVSANKQASDIRLADVGMNQPVTVKHFTEYDIESLPDEVLDTFSLGQESLLNLDNRGNKFYVAGRMPVSITDKGTNYMPTPGGITEAIEKRALKPGLPTAEIDMLRSARRILHEGNVRRNIAEKAIASFNAAILTNNFHTILRTFPDILRVNAPLETVLGQTWKSLMPTNGSHYSDFFAQAMMPHTTRSFYDGTAMKGLPDATRFMEAKLRAANFGSIFETEMSQAAKVHPFLQQEIQKQGGMENFLTKFVMDKPYQKEMDLKLGAVKAKTFKQLYAAGIDSVRHTQGAISSLDHRPVTHTGVGQLLLPFKDAQFAMAGHTLQLAKDVAAGKPGASLQLARFLRPYLLTLASGTSLSALLGDKAYQAILQGLSMAGLSDQAMAFDNLDKQAANTSQLATFMNTSMKSIMPSVTDVVSVLPTTDTPATMFIDALNQTNTGDPALRSISTAMASLASMVANQSPTLSSVSHLMAPSLFGRAVSEGSKALGVNPQSVTPGVFRDQTGVRTQNLDTQFALNLLIGGDPAKKEYADGILRQDIAKQYLNKVVDSGVPVDQVLELHPDLDVYLDEVAAKKGFTDPEKIDGFKLRFVKQSTSGVEVRKMSELASMAFDPDTPPEQQQQYLSALQQIAATVDWSNTNYSSLEEFLQDKMQDVESK